jgi:hypothetical protein
MTLSRSQSLVRLRAVGTVPVELGPSVVSVPVVAQDGARTRIELTDQGPTVVIAEGLSPDRAQRAVAAVLPALVKLLSSRVLN